MKYIIPFKLRNKDNCITVEYNRMSNEIESGFWALSLPFDTKMCIGYPMLHAYFENMSLNGYERYCGWIQIIRREEYITINGEEVVNVVYDLDYSSEQIKPYFCVGYPAELFDAPCNNLGDNEKLIWTAYTYLVDLPSRMNDNKLVFLAGFSWGYTENDNKEVELLNFEILTKEDWEKHREIATL